MAIEKVKTILRALRCSSGMPQAKRPTCDGCEYQAFSPCIEKMMDELHIDYPTAKHLCEYCDTERIHNDAAKVLMAVIAVLDKKAPDDSESQK